MQEICARPGLGTVGPTWLPIVQDDPTAPGGCDDQVEHRIPGENLLRQGFVAGEPQLAVGGIGDRGVRKGRRRHSLESLQWTGSFKFHDRAAFAVKRGLACQNEVDSIGRGPGGHDLGQVKTGKRQRSSGRLEREVG